MYVHLDWQDEKEVSFTEIRDKLMLVFIKNGFFLSQETGLPIEYGYRTSPRNCQVFGRAEADMY